MGGMVRGHLRLLLNYDTPIPSSLLLLSRFRPTFSRRAINIPLSRARTSSPIRSDTSPSRLHAREPRFDDTPVYPLARRLIPRRRGLRKRCKRNKRAKKFVRVADNEEPKDARERRLIEAIMACRDRERRKRKERRTSKKLEMIAN